MKKKYLTFVVALLSVFGYSQNVNQEIQLSQLSFAAMKQEVIAPVSNSSMTGERIMIKGKTYATGISVHAPSSGTLYVGGKGIRFKADVGVDDLKNRRPNAKDHCSLQFHFPQGG